MICGYFKIVNEIVMAKGKKNKATDFKIGIGLTEGQTWSDSKLANMKALIKRESAKRFPEQKLKNDLLGIKYQMEEYIENTGSDNKKLQGIDKFLNAYLSSLNLQFKQFALYIDTTDGNLKKYLSGQRKFNTDLAMKFGYFFHTSPDLWLRVQLKNELIVLRKQQKQVSRYKKYDYTKVVEML
jgi:antitoxin HigA-1